MRTRAFIIGAIVLALSSCAALRDRQAVDSYHDEEINIGYGSTTRSRLTDSVSKVSIDDNEMSGYSDIFEYLRGRVPGLIIGPSAPGSMPSIRVRGTSSINASNEPLILVDGTERADISDLNPRDVKSVEVLKGPSAAIYGVRSAAGVILITTKR